MNAVKACKNACVARSSTPSGFACARRLSKEDPKLSPHALWVGVSQLIRPAKHAMPNENKSTTSKALPQPEVQRTRIRMNQVQLRMSNIWQSKLIKKKYGKKGTRRGKGTLFAKRAFFEIEHDQLPGPHFFVAVGSNSVQHWPLSIAAASQSCSAVAKKRPKLQAG